MPTLDKRGNPGEAYGFVFFFSELCDDVVSRLCFDSTQKFEAPQSASDCGRVLFFDCLERQQSTYKVEKFAQ